MLLALLLTYSQANKQPTSSQKPVTTTIHTTQPSPEEERQDQGQDQDQDQDDLPFGSYQKDNLDSCWLVGSVCTLSCMMGWEETSAWKTVQGEKASIIEYDPMASQRLMSSSSSLAIPNVDVCRPHCWWKANTICMMRAIHRGTFVLSTLFQPVDGKVNDLGLPRSYIARPFRTSLEQAFNSSCEPQTQLAHLAHCY